MNTASRGCGRFGGAVLLAADVPPGSGCGASGCRRCPPVGDAVRRGAVDAECS